MQNFLASKLRLSLVAPIAAAAVCAYGFAQAAGAQPAPEPGKGEPAQAAPTPEGPARRAPAAGTPFYNPPSLPSSNEVSDTLTDKDVPTGFGGFYRDYLVNFEEGDQVVMDLTSEEFDTIISLIAPDGSTVTENDDGPDGSTNSLLFARITRPGSYIIRVSPYAGQGTGSFKLKVTRLRPV